MTGTRIAELEAEVAALKTEQQALVRLRKLVDLMPTGFLVIDNRGRITESNPAAEALLGSQVQDQAWIEVIQQCFAPRPDDGHEVSLKNGRRVLLSTLALPDEPGQLVFMTDQTQTRDLQSKLHHYQRLSEMGRMMASLAHQVRTPLSAALIYAAHLCEAELTDAQRIRFATKVRQQLTHLEQQVRDMLIFARGETRLDNQVSTTELLLRIEDMLDQPLAQYDAECEFINHAGEQSLQCNLEALLGAVLNLVNNALQACGQQAALEIRLDREANDVLISVIDNGPGMDDEALQKAQQPFYTTKTHGTGLGLAIAQVIARAHHGQFELASIPGQGTCARFRLPLIQST
ncbi:Flagellar sensor histidine kinase FleS [Nitrincola lacisaponensis]|uniref:histidine kinase n=1 Tax=Nitrincola lacisaponensis TaxID=267850 RepID=A0A063Y528_9GAMM|nr:ATP-binding protein [Nitrincola lacisaponensis]KDE39617.1 Flagellar sensor histidine kinase FleS [Nitrincola lacisaponensis]